MAIVFWIILFVLVWLYFKNRQIEIPQPFEPEPVQPNVIEQVTDQEIHNKMVLDQLETYLNNQSVPNYTTDNISAGTLKMYDIRDNFMN